MPVSKNFSVGLETGGMPHRQIDASWQHVIAGCRAG
jgi:hypothetical protein